MSDIIISHISCEEGEIVFFCQFQSDFRTNKNCQFFLEIIIKLFPNSKKDEVCHMIREGLKILFLNGMINLWSEVDRLSENSLFRDFLSHKSL